jgi:hypothetical protein
MRIARSIYREKREVHAQPTTVARSLLLFTSNDSKYLQKIYRI